MALYLASFKSFSQILTLVSYSWRLFFKTFLYFLKRSILWERYSSEIPTNSPDSSFPNFKSWSSLITLAGELDIFPEVLMATDAKNDTVRKNKDWEKMQGRAVI